MTKQTINVGTSANDRKGDSLRTAFQKVNANFTELYSSSGFTGTTDRLVNGAAEFILNLNGSTPFVTFPAHEGESVTVQGSEIGSTDSALVLSSFDNRVIIGANAQGPRKNWEFGTDGTLTFPDGLTVIDSVFERRVESEGDAVGSKLTITDTDISIERYLDPDGLNNIERARVYANNSGVGMAYTSESVGGIAGATIAVDGASASISATDGVLTNNWVFDVSGETILPGSLQLPSISYIRQRHSFTRTTTASAPAATSTVVWSANQDWTSAIKLTIQVEGNVTGDATGWHVQTCEATIASRGYANGISGYGDPEMTVYGVIHTSVSPLATFEVQRNATTRFVEVVATGADVSNNIIVSIHSVEIGTTD